MELHLKQTQKQVLSQNLRQSLNLLEVPAAELYSVIEEEVLSNPLIDIKMPVCPAMTISGSERYSEFRGGEGDRNIEFADELAHPQSYRDYLCEQLGQMRLLDQGTRSLCEFLIGCLNRSGYLDEDLGELAETAGVTEFDIEQALFVIQDLDPPGTGARNLSECLVLQLAKSKHFDALHVHLAVYGLEHLAENNYKELAANLGTTVDKAKKAAGVIKSLNPIPSSGFFTGEPTGYICPEAEIHCERDELCIVMNAAAIPRLSLQNEYCSLLDDPEHAEIQDYLLENFRKANELIDSVEKRSHTIEKVLKLIIQKQRAFFLGTGPLKPFSMRMAAEILGLHISTISRAVKDKYIVFEGNAIPIKSLFSRAFSETNESVSADWVKALIKTYIRTEDRGDPLSDASITKRLNDVGISVSRRTVAKYRSEESLPGAAERKSTYKKAGRIPADT